MNKYTLCSYFLWNSEENWVHQFDLVSAMRAFRLRNTAKLLVTTEAWEMAALVWESDFVRQAYLALLYLVLCLDIIWSGEFVRSMVAKLFLKTAHISLPSLVQQETLHYRNNKESKKDQDDPHHVLLLLDDDLNVLLRLFKGVLKICNLSMVMTWLLKLNLWEKETFFNFLRNLSHSF